MSELKRMTVQEAALLVGQNNVVLLDMRDVRSYKCGHIPGAVNLSDFNIRPLLKQLNKELVVIVYCYHGNSSRDMSVLFSDFGFVHCYSLDGGYEEWQKHQTNKSRLPEIIINWMQESGFDENDLESRGYNGETPLMYAAREGKTDFVVSLIDRGAELEARNLDGNTAVWLACFSGNQNTLEVLLEEGASVDVQNEHGATPLIYAASHGRHEMVQMLLDARADVEKTTLDGFTALDVASSYSILMYLKSHQLKQARY